MSRREEGGVAALVAVLMSALAVMLLGSGVELGRWRLARLELYQVADLAALAGLEATDPGQTFGGQPRLHSGRAAQLALASAEANLARLSHSWASPPRVSVQVQETGPPMVEVILEAELTGTIVARLIRVSGTASLEVAR